MSREGIVRMSPERWNRIQELFIAAADMDGSERDLFLRAECAGDADLLMELRSLLDCDNKSSITISLGVQQAAASLMLSDSLAGKRIGPYAIIRELGQGGMGAVYLAARADDQYQKQVAIKLVKRGMDTEAVLESFRYERQILANLDHPYIARLLDGGTTTTGVPYFVMEFVKGKPVHEFVVEHSLNLEERCGLFLKVCEAVSYAHRNLVIHRDLKPTNILVTEDGTPKLLDFGIAKVLNPQSTGSTKTTHAHGMLTPDYASPEQVRGGLATTAMDVYSLGAIFYELLTGVKPHQLQTCDPVEVEHVICETDPTRPSSHSQRLAGDLDNIVLMSMRKEPERRYASVDQFGEDIQRHLNGLPVMAREDTIRYRAGKFLRRHRLGAVASFLIACSLLAGVASTAMESRRAEQQRRIAETERSRAESHSRLAERHRQIAESEHKEADTQRDIAITERKDAEQQRQRAENRLKLLVELANRSLFEVHTAIERLPGAIGARRKIVDSTLAYLNEMSKDAPGDPVLLRTIASAYEKVGDIQGLPGRASLGDEEGAWKSYQTANQLNLQCLRLDPSDFDALITRMGLLQRIGMLLNARGKSQEALGMYQDALVLAERVVSRQIDKRPEEDQKLARIQIGIMEHAIAMQLSTPDPERAVKHVEREIELYTAMSKQYPEDTELINSIGSACNQMGKILVSRNQLKEALAQFQKGAQMREALRLQRPDDSVIARNLAVSYGYIGDTLGNPTGPNLGDRKAALEAFHKSEKLMLRLVTADPANLSATADLAAAQLRIGATLIGPEERNESLATLNKAKAAYETLCAKNPANLTHRQKLASAEYYIGERMRESGATQTALDHYRAALRLVEEILKKTPNDAVVRDQAAGIRQGIAKIS